MTDDNRIKFKDELGAGVFARKEKTTIDYYPTPPWATRALCEHLDGALKGTTIWEPAAGGGHMAEVLKEYGAHVIESDKYDHDHKGHLTVCDFLESGTRCPHHREFDIVSGEDLQLMPDWIITNPPFACVNDFIGKALDRAENVAMLCRIALLESRKRYDKLFKNDPPSEILVFSERVSMSAGKIDPNRSSTVCYAWYLWREKNRFKDKPPSLYWVPPGSKDKWS